MAGWTTSTENAILNAWLRNAAPSLPSALHLGLYTVLPNDDGAGGTEVGAGDYARQAVTFAVAASGETTNSNTLTFTASAANAWGTIIGFGLFTASTGGTPIFVGAVDPQMIVSVGSPVAFASGTVKITQD